MLSVFKVVFVAVYVIAFFISVYIDKLMEKDVMLGAVYLCLKVVEVVSFIILLINGVFR